MSNTHYDAVLSQDSLQDAGRFMPWIVTFSASLFFFYEFIQMNMFNAIDHSLVVSFNLTPDALGQLSSIYFFANVLFLFPAGILLDRFSTKKIIFVSMGLCVFGTLLFATSDVYWMAYLSRFSTGIGSAFCFLSCIRLASRWFPARRMALVSGLIVTVAMLGGVVAQKPLYLAVELLGWRHALLLDGLLGIIMLLVIAMGVVDSPVKEQSSDLVPPSISAMFNSFKQIFSHKQIWFAAFYTSLMNMPLGIMGVVWGLPYLMNVHGLSQAEATEITTMIFMGTIIGGPCLGWLSDSLGARKPLMIFGSILSITTIFLMLSLHQPGYWILFFMFFALGLFTSSQILTYPLVSESNSKAHTAMATSIVSFITQGGIAVFQLIFGNIVADHAMLSDMAGMQSYSALGLQHALLMIPLGFIVALVFALCLIEK